MRLTFLGIEFIDELVSGFPVVALPLIRDDFGLNYAQLGLLFSLGHAASWLLEPIISVYSDRGSKRPFVLGGLLLLTAGFAMAASAGSFASLVVAFGIIFPAGGAAVGLAQAALIDDDTAGAERAMARWTLFGAVGDLASPLTVAAVLALDGGWRLLFTGAALLWCVPAALLWRQRLRVTNLTARNVEGEAETKSPAGTLALVRVALRQGSLLRWIGVILAADMLDEVFLGFAALYLRDGIGASPAAVGLALAAQTAGGLLGLVVLERTIVCVAAPARLVLTALIAAAAFGGLLLIHSVWLAALALSLIGFGASSWYPVAKAAAYRTLPGRTGTARAVTDLIATPFNVALPAAAGAVASGLGIAAGVGALGLAPLAVLTLAVCQRKAEQARRAG